MCDRITRMGTELATPSTEQPTVEDPDVKLSAGRTRGPLRVGAATPDNDGPIHRKAGDPRDEPGG